MRCLFVMDKIGRNPFPARQSDLFFDKSITISTIVLMKITTDTNTFLATALNEPEKQAIINLTCDHELIAPTILPFEIGNALSAMVKRGRLTRQEGLLAYDETDKIPVELHSIDIRRALTIAGQYKIYAYDAYFLECARAARSPLLTLDAALKTIAVKLGIKLLEVES